jgi:tripartite-type tricarboxylate transporter receptor subunit TctC
MRLISAFGVVLACVICFPTGVGAVDYPTKPVRVIVTKSTGSATDFVARAVSDQLSGLWGQPVVVENHPATAGATGASFVANAAPDEYTLLVHSSGYVVDQVLSDRLSDDPERDFVDIAPLARQPLVLVVSQTSALKNVSDLIAEANAKPGELRYGTPGTGSAAYIAGEEFKAKAGIDVVHVPHGGGPETLAATADGRVSYSFLPLALALKGGQAGKIVGLSVTSAQRTSAMPDVPTIAEAGFPGFEKTVWWGVWAPAETPDSVVTKIAADIARSLATPALLTPFEKRKLEPMKMSSAEFARFVRTEWKSAERVFKEAREAAK